MAEFTYSDAGLALTKSFEGLRLESYQDVAGIWTVGYGHTGPDVLAGMSITEPEADSLLRADVVTAVNCVNRGVTAEISQAQFDAMVDLCFNIGQGNFLKSSLLRYLNQGDFESAAAQFLVWVNAGGKRVEGLVRRRQAERSMFVGDNAVGPAAG